MFFVWRWFFKIKKAMPYILSLLSIRCYLKASIFLIHIRGLILSGFYIFDLVVLLLLSDLRSLISPLRVLFTFNISVFRVLTSSMMLTSTVTNEPRNVSSFQFLILLLLYCVDVIIYRI